MRVKLTPFKILDWFVPALPFLVVALAVLLHAWFTNR